MGVVKGRPRPEFDRRLVARDGGHVRLEPLRTEQAAALFADGNEEEIWRFVIPRPTELAHFEGYVRLALDQAVLGQQLPFAVVRKTDGEIVGTTRYAHIDPPDHTLEIGYTWYGKGARRTPVNTEAKLLPFPHAFQTLKPNRVCLQPNNRHQP